MPSNIQIIKPEQKQASIVLAERRSETTQGGQRKQVVDFSKVEISKLPLFKDVEPERWRALYVAKLRACHKLADFSDAKKDTEFKEQKKETMIDLIDTLDDVGNAQAYLFNEAILKEAIKLVEANIFRTFTNKATKKSSSVDPDEDEPHLEEAWPHLQLIYELLLKFVMTTLLPTSTIAQSISNSFLKQMLDLFDSEDPRERDYLKTILHRIYGKFMSLRTPIRVQVMNLLLKVTYENESHNGLTEMLEILSSIISGFASPLKPEHQEFFKRVMLPLHRVKTLSTFNTQLQLCIKHFIEKDSQLSIVLIKGLLKIWPITNPAKEVVFLNEVEELLESNWTVIQGKFTDFGPKLLKRLIKTSQSMHYQAAERALVLLNSDTIQKLVRLNKPLAYPLIVKNLILGSQSSHWNQTVTTITYSVMRSYMEMDPDSFEKLTTVAQGEEKAKAAKGREIEGKWARLEARVGK
ncbi:hypothetical protein FGO68_gene16483 [Halteria grandinella]|uniref:Serine/threonine protein phosphatase 2A regulatory subunit n=1 Tax=Halteria grandinella TaxID=5974 RepID=A0A8J8NR16_HALGN|nr:hypothetical protein FGO68_gene16483 [Halteria grandinella]